MQFGGFLSLEVGIYLRPRQDAKGHTQNLTVTWSFADLCSRWSKSSWFHNQKDTAKLNSPGRPARKKLLCSMKNMKARLTFGKRNVDKAQDFMVFGQMDLNSSAVALAPNSICCFYNHVSGVSRHPKLPIGFESVSTDTPRTKQSGMSSLITSFPVIEYTSLGTSAATMSVRSSYNCIRATDPSGSRTLTFNLW